MTHFDPEQFARDPGRSREERLADENPTLRQTSRFRSPDDEDVVGGGMRHAAGIWRIIRAERRQRRQL